MRKIFLLLGCVLLLLSCNKKAEEIINTNERYNNNLTDEEERYLMENDEPTPLQNFSMSNIYDGSKYNYKLDEKGNLFTLEDYTFYKVEDKFVSNYFAITEEYYLNRITYAGSNLFFIKTGDVYDSFIFTGLQDANEGMYIIAKTELDPETTRSILKNRRQTTLKTGIVHIIKSDKIALDVLNKEQYNQVKNALVVVSTHIRNENENGSPEKVSDYLWSKIGQHTTEYTISDYLNIYILN